MTVVSGVGLLVGVDLFADLRTVGSFLRFFYWRHCRPLTLQLRLSLLTAGIKKIKLYDITTTTLDAIKATIPDAEVTVGVPNYLIPGIASDYNAALQMVQPLVAYSSIVKYVTVSNRPDEDATLKNQLATVVLSAVTNVFNALKQLNVNAKVSVPFTHGGMIANSYPVSNSQLNPTLAPGIRAILKVRVDEPAK